MKRLTDSKRKRHRDLPCPTAQPTSLADAHYYQDEKLYICHTQAGSPKWERHDCAVIALAVALDVSYELVHELLRVWGREDRGPMPAFDYWLKLGPLRWKRYVRKPVTIQKFANKHPTGNFLVFFRPKGFLRKGKESHAAALRDGTLYDCGITRPRMRVTAAWQFVGLRKEFTGL